MSEKANFPKGEDYYKNITCGIIRKKYQNWKGASLIDCYAMLLSPMLTKLLLIKEGILPNQVTVMMMISGIVGAVLFAIPILPCRIIGVLFIHLWYVLDCSDGEIARITQRFSRYGKQIDYTAHILNHPLFVFSFYISLIQSMGGYKNLFMGIIAFFLVAFDLMRRNLMVFMEQYSEKEGCGGSGEIKKTRIGNGIRWIIRFFIDLPNFILTFPIVFLVDFKLSILFMIFVVIVEFATVPRMLIKWVRNIVNK